MSALASSRMAIDEFVAWAAEQGGDERWELVDGVPVRMMAPQTRRHGEVKGLVWLALRGAIAKQGLPCTAVLDSAGVRIDDQNSRIPDVSVECGETGEADGIWLNDPVILIEVVSKGSVRRDERDKLIDYFRLPSLVHYLVVYPGEELVVHHRRVAERDDLSTAFVREGDIDLTPPGLTVPIGRFFESGTMS